MVKSYVILTRNDLGIIRFVAELSASDIPVSQAHSYLDYYRRNFGVESAECADIYVDDGYGILVKVVTAT